MSVFADSIQCKCSPQSSLHHRYFTQVLPHLPAKHCNSYNFTKKVDIADSDTALSKKLRKRRAFLLLFSPYWIVGVIHINSRNRMTTLYYFAHAPSWLKVHSSDIAGDTTDRKKKTIALKSPTLSQYIIKGLDKYHRKTYEHLYMLSNHLSLHPSLFRHGLDC